MTIEWNGMCWKRSDGSRFYWNRERTHVSVMLNGQFHFVGEATTVDQVKSSALSWRR